MPALTFHGGKLRLLYYDLREDVSQLFGPFVDEVPILTADAAVRHTMDVFVAQARRAAAPVFTTARLSDYAIGFLPGSTVEQRLQFNPPNLPLFRQGTMPFMGDYIDLAPAPPFVQNDERHVVATTRRRTAARCPTRSGPTTATCGRRPTATGRTTRRSRRRRSAMQSRFDPTQPVPACEPGQVGMRNQNIYTARVTDGLFVSAPGNNKPFDGFQRAFVVVAENASRAAAHLPADASRISRSAGQASFLQFGPPLTTLDVSMPALSSVARTRVRDAHGSERAHQRVDHRDHWRRRRGRHRRADRHRGAESGSADPAAAESAAAESAAAEPGAAEHFAGRGLQPGHHDAVVGVPNLQNPVLQNPVCRIRTCRIRRFRIRGCRTEPAEPELQTRAAERRGRESGRRQRRICRIRTCRTRVLQNPRLQNPALQNPNLQNAASATRAGS